MNIGFIGAGKVGCTLGKYFSQIPDVTIVGYYSKSSESAEDAAQFTGSRSYDSIGNLVEACDTIFLTVPDGSIHDTWEKVREYNIKGKIICHCSGALSSDDAFRDIGSTGAFGYSAHPLFAVSDRYNAYRELTDVFFALEGKPAEGLRKLQELLVSMGNPVGIIKSKDKIKYHCGAAIASNLVCGLVQLSVELMTQCGFTEKEAIKALSPILVGNMAHIAEAGPTDSLTGPVERNDMATVEKHLACFTEEEDRQLYALLTRKLVVMAQNRHSERDYSELINLIDDTRKTETIHNEGKDEIK